MVLYASYAKQSDVVTGIYPRACSNCRHVTGHALMRQERKARVYGIPVAKWGESFQTWCATCEHRVEVDAETLALYTQIHIRNEPVETPYFDEASSNPSARRAIAEGWDNAVSRVYENLWDFVGRNNVESEKEVALLAIYAAAGLAADDLGIDYYQAIQFFILDEPNRCRAWADEVETFSQRE